MSKIDQDLAAALKQAKTKPMFFAVVVKGPAEGTLIVSKNKVVAKAIAEAKNDLGGGVVYQGRCSGDATGQLIFETAKEPPATLVKTLKWVVNHDAGLTLKLDARKGAGLAADDEEASAAVPDKDGIRKRLAAIAAQYTKIQQGPVASGPDATSLHSQLDATKSSVAKEDWAAAAKNLDEMDRLVIRATSGALIFQIGWEDGNARYNVPPPNRRPALAKRPDLSDLLHYYDEGYRAGAASLPKMPDYIPPNNSPTMGPNTMTKDQEEEGRRIDESRKELKRVLSGGHDDDMPHTDPEPPKIENEPPVGD